jgi:hypothetical protein
MSQRSHDSRRLRKTGDRSALAALILLLLAAFLPARASLAIAQRADAFVLIIGSSTGVTDISSDVVRTAFLGLRAEFRGVRLIPLNLPLRTFVRERLDRVLLGLEPSEVGSFWIDQRVRDGRSPPRTVSSAELAVRVVAQLPGAVACVPATFVDPHVRALRIDGKGPSEKGYLLAPE